MQDVTVTGSQPSSAVDYAKIKGTESKTSIEDTEDFTVIKAEIEIMDTAAEDDDFGILPGPNATPAEKKALEVPCRTRIQPGSRADIPFTLENPDGRLDTSRTSPLPAGTRLGIGWALRSWAGRKVAIRMTR